MRATPRLRRRGVGSGLDSTRVLDAHGEGDDPDRWGPPVGGGGKKRKEAPGRIGLGGGKWAGGGFLGRGERKEMELGRLGWNQGEEKEKALYF